MPTASVKTDSKSNGPSANQDPLGRMNSLMEKKIRNLEKRKNKLENYKDELAQGKELNDDQQRAVSAYDSVITSLDLCREFALQIDGVIAENAKITKQQLKKQQEEKARQDLDRIKQVLIVQDVLMKLAKDSVRKDFLAAANGAITLTEENLKNLDELSKLVSPWNSGKTLNPAAFKTQLASSSDNMLSLLDGKTKQLGSGTTFKDMKTLINQIATCPYSKTTNKKSTSPKPQLEKTVKPKKNKGKSPATTNITSDKINKINKTEDNEVDNKTSFSASQESVLINKNLPLSNLPTCAKIEEEERKSLIRTQPLVIANPTINLSAQDQCASLSSLSPQKSSTVPQVNAAPLTQSSNTFYDPTSQQPKTLRSKLDINDLVTKGSFNFLQESQVGTEESSVYIDPAVVSFGSIKPESLVHMHEQQKLSQTIPHSIGAGLSDSSTLSQIGKISTETYQPYSSSELTTYSQTVPSYSSNARVGGGTTYIPPPIPLPKDSQDKGYSNQSNSWADQQSPPRISPTEEEGWGDSNVEDNSWDTVETAEPAARNTWMDETKPLNQNSKSRENSKDFDQRNDNYRSRGGRGRGGYRIGRGGSGGYNNNYGSGTHGVGSGGSRGNFRGGRGNPSVNGINRGMRGGSYRSNLGFRIRGGYHSGNQARNRFQSNN